MKQIVIVGGGISGLATAFYLQRYAETHQLPLRYTVLEASERFGGKIVTEQTDNFVIEGGPDSFITQKPWGVQLCRDLGIEDRLLPTNDVQRNVFVLRRGKLVKFPAGYRLSIPTEFWPFIRSPLISWPGKLRMGLDLVIPPRRDKADESLASFIRRRLGNEALDVLAQPLMAGIYVADAEELSMDSSFPMFRQLEQKHGSLIKAMRLAKAKRPPSNGKKPPAVFCSFKNGMRELITSLRQQLTGDLRLNCAVNSISKTDAGYQLTTNTGDTLSADAVVLTTPAYIASTLTRPLNRPLADLLSQIRYVSTATVSLGFRKQDLQGQHDLNGFGFVIPRSEGRYIQACTWTSTKLAHRADEHHQLIRVFVGGPRRQRLVNLSNEDLTQLARMELLTTMGITAQPITSHIFRWQRGAPQYDVGHLERVVEMERQAAQHTPGLFITGSALRGVGIPDCVKSALSTVDALGSYLQS